ncbi:hypothetical protein O7599_17065 [Streptomyces sp. WMMC500]|uniref:hypothetical protein n=1 Tax=Streptomyces sp. WMMC500 TaxID=3015154 RepID=UPI00248B12BA|nr:hypothetical protein [Streptomyces sp. WMMC500]WBB64119.1 hypothetical protein O7599_17065 [Streptomyces sp. WMMC500]
MAFWRRNRARKTQGRTAGSISVNVFDPRRPGPVERPGLLLGERRLPGITVSSFSDRLTAHARGLHPPGTGPVAVIMQHSMFAEEDQVVVMGLARRPAMVVRMTPRLRADLYDLGEAIVADGAVLYLDAHEGFLRASLALPAMTSELDTGMLLREGNVQEFLEAAYATETVELHIQHTAHDRLLNYTCAAPGIRAVLDEGFDLYTQSPPADLRASLEAVNDSLDPAVRVPLRVTGNADLAVAYDAEV